ncbi:glutamate synthase [Vulcanisaeta thermophila]|uniref:GltB/FmdC/FwdC-like GXGXG domain-containing protein n=1 Tax=Vulcanisaeta thermophila TaxID=867917 RepID=UPI00192E5F84|nr:glutamate synthase [Vulcanisaeta thermophila]
MAIVNKYPSGCGILGIMRRSYEKVHGDVVVRAIETVRFRGAGLGAGFALMNAESMGMRVGLFIREPMINDYLNSIKEVLGDAGFKVTDVRVRARVNGIADLELPLSGDGDLDGAIGKINDALWEGGIGRVYYWGSHVTVFKGVGHPADIASIYNVERYEADLWLSHTRFPTNSPGYMPYWSHPFSVNDLAIVHNGELSSYGLNTSYLRYTMGINSFVGTDSEVVAYLMHYLVRVYGFDVEDAVKLLTSPNLKNVSDEGLRELLTTYKWARLDGPFTIVMGLHHNDDLYLIAIADKFKLRPVVVGMDDDYYYVASEEAEIRAVSPNARVWTLEPGGYFIASLKRGVISWGRDETTLDIFFPVRAFPTYTGSDAINAEGLGYRELNEEILRRVREGRRVIRVVNVNGQRFIGVNLPRYGVKDVRIELYGTPGNSLANLNNGVEFVVYGNAQDDVGDTMHGGRVVIHGDARDVLGQTLQGGEIFVRGNAGNRVGIQMREYRDKRPYLIIGGRVDDYLGEYMAGGVIMVLGIDSIGKCGVELTGKYVGSGMVGGRIYIRGRVSSGKIGLTLSSIEIRNFMRAIEEEGLSNEEAQELYELMTKSEHVKRVGHEYRELTESEIKELKPVLMRYVNEFNLGIDLINDLLSYKYTVVTPIT